MNGNSVLSAETYAKIDDFMRIARTAVVKAQQESRRRGVPNVYSINGRIYYELPNGELSLEDPYPKSQKNAE
ncbi:hypothetical protein [Aeoliella sp.]|uniref:hypothetical protein n=1 Tax=Aeoliella sp. TaxID=2795800 RepID=UPI003CCC45CC